MKPKSLYICYRTPTLYSRSRDIEVIWWAAPIMGKINAKSSDVNEYGTSWRFIPKDHK
jgi:hypothetical protein